MGDPVCGVEYKSFSHIEKDHLEIFNNQKFAFVSVPLSQRNEKYEFQPLEIYNYNFEWGTKVIGVIPDNINVDSEDVEIRSKSVNLLKKTFKLASYVGVNTVMLNLENDRNANLARMCAYHLHESHGRPLWLRINVSKDSDCDWRKWNNFLTLLPENQNKIGLVLELSEEVPSDQDMMRWYSEVLLGLSISTSLFVANKGGYPVLRREFQELISNSFKKKVQVIVHGEDIHGLGMDAYQKYIYHLYENKEPSSVYEEFSRGYEELLQIPLQPLKDNLDNSTYEVFNHTVLFFKHSSYMLKLLYTVVIVDILIVPIKNLLQCFQIFEKDPIKYKQYEEAVYQILLDRGKDIRV